MKLTTDKKFDDAESMDLALKDKILFKSLRGSVTQGTDGPNSDRDTYGIAFDPSFLRSDELIQKYSDERSDNFYYEISKFAELLLSSNPDTIELIHIDPKFWIVKPVTELEWIFNNPELFISKDMVKTFTGFIDSQLHKSLTKLHQKMETKVKDFKDKKFEDFLTVMVPWETGDKKYPLLKFLEMEGLDRKYLKRVELLRNDNSMDELMKAVSKLPREYAINIELDYFNSVSLMYYSWRRAYEDGVEIPVNKLFLTLHEETEKEKFGILRDSAITSGGNLLGSAQVSVEESPYPIGLLFYDGKRFETFCKEKREYQQWYENRNPQRFLNNQGSSYDIKNMAHAVRTYNMLIEVFESGTLVPMKLDRTGIDSDYIKSIKYQTDDNRIPLEDMIKILEEKKSRLLKAVESNTCVPDHISQDTVERLKDSVYKIRMNRL